jgi:hypothetical protein
MSEKREGQRGRCNEEESDEPTTYVHESVRGFPIVLMTFRQNAYEMVGGSTGLSPQPFRCLYSQFTRSAGRM